MKPPNQKKCTIGEMLEWCSQNNGKVTGTKTFLIQWTLSNISKLSQIARMKWSQREWAMKALDDIERIGVLDKLELRAPRDPVQSTTSQIEAVAKTIGLHTYMVNRELLITRNPLTFVEEESAAEMKDSEFPIEIDQNAKPTELCTLPKSSQNSNA